MAEVQSYVLRSWEKEFPGIGLDSTMAGGRLYRQSDVEQVRRIRQLVFGEGLTVSGARRRLEADGDQAPVSKEAEAEVFDALGNDARARVAAVQEGLRALQSMLSAEPGQHVSPARPVAAKPAARTRKATKPPAAGPLGTARKAGRATKRKRASA